MRRRTAIAALLYAAAATRLGGPVHAAEFAPKQLAGMLLRILAYDRNVKTRANGKAIPILVLYVEGDAASEAVQSDVVNALEELAGTVTVAGLRVQISALPYSNLRELEAKLTALHPVAMFVCPGLADALPGLILATRKRAVLTMTVTPTYLKAGLSVGLAHGAERVNILINLPAARAEGADLDADLLRLAEVYR